MRPVPQSRHVAALLILVAVACATGYLASYDYRLSDVQEDAAATALKRHNPALYPFDPIFGPSRLWQYRPPALQSVLEMILVPSGYADPVFPFRLLAPVMAIVYLVGMYVLLFRQTGSWSVSVFVAALSMVVIPGPGAGFWGAGALSAVTSGGLVIMATPLIVIAYLRHRGTWRMLVVFLLVGLLANVHLAMAGNLGLVLLLTYLAKRRFALPALLRGAQAVGAGLLGAAPYLLYCTWLHRDLTPPGAEILPHSVFEAIAFAGWDVLYPAILRGLIGLPMLMFLIVIPTAVVMARVERFSVRDFPFWAWFLGMAMTVAFVFQGLSQLVGMLRPQGPPVLSFILAYPLILLPLYVLFAQVLTNLFRLVHRQRALLRWACAILAVAWVVPSKNFRVARYALLDTIVQVTGNRARLPRVQRNRERTAQHAEFIRMGLHLRQATPPTTVFLCPRNAFRMHARRSLVAAENDLPWLYRFAPWRLSEWTRRMRLQSALLHASVLPHPDDVRAFLAQLPPEPYALVPEWCLVIPSPPIRQRSEHFVPVFSGQFYQVYRFVPDPPPATTTAPATAPATAPTTAPAVAPATGPATRPTTRAVAD